jgi:hypothetical protein
MPRMPGKIGREPSEPAHLSFFCINTPPHFHSDQVQHLSLDNPFRKSVQQLPGTYRKALSNS